MQLHNYCIIVDLLFYFIPFYCNLFHFILFYFISFCITVLFSVIILNVSSDMILFDYLSIFNFY